MRIEFANIERPGVDWNRRDLSIGSAPDNDLVLAGPGVAPHHLRITHDARGLVLAVEPGAGRVYVNARRVRERALLRAGDNIGIGDVRLRLCRESAEGRAGHVGVASLRAVAGPLSGRARLIGDRLDLGQDGPWPLGLSHAPDACISLVREEGAIRVQGRDIPASMFLGVNGMATREMVLRNGDQVTLGPHRFVIEACADGSGQSDPQTDQGMPTPLAKAGPRREVWWLILTAALLALAISILLLL